MHKKLKNPRFLAIAFAARLSGQKRQQKASKMGPPLSTFAKKALKSLGKKP